MCNARLGELPVSVAAILTDCFQSTLSKFRLHCYRCKKLANIDNAADAHRFLLTIIASASWYKRVLINMIHILYRCPSPTSTKYLEQRGFGVLTTRMALVIGNLSQ